MLTLMREESMIQVIERNERSFLMRILQVFLRPFGHRLISSNNTTPAGSQHLSPHRTIMKQCTVTEREVEGLFIYDLEPKSPPAVFQQHKPYRIYYFGGGGWQMPPSSEHWKMGCELCMQLSDVTTSLVSYPLGPHSPAPVAFPQLLTMYRSLMRSAYEAGETVTLMGDSAGGNVILALTIEALRQHPDSLAPKSLFVICPSTDLTRENPAIRELEPMDPLLDYKSVLSSAKNWAGGWDRADPRVSPLFADIALLAAANVKVNGITAGYDVLSPDAILFRERCAKAGIQGKWLHWEKQMHCFVLAWVYGLRESKEAKDWMIETLRKVFTSDTKVKTANDGINT
ncbi:alpha/beta-hydrolase [Patellaria atrata CBS 101060]|uniref:Alpha/beta-hydrolase n=1 Tax=Patellaria atrata CBS 101060 TaxID=1346257 RepID=A0A9P4SEX9_9PEZI|nr:alpha/beta-hydrolase [Patellaria atrata CBS 101060]